VGEGHERLGLIRGISKHDTLERGGEEKECEEGWWVEGRRRKIVLVYVRGRRRREGEMVYEKEEG
jgi:hypothetical protein